MQAEALLLQCAPVIADLNSVKASVGMTMLAACQMAARDGVRVVLSGLGLQGIANYLALLVQSCPSQKVRYLFYKDMWYLPDARFVSILPD